MATTSDLSKTIKFIYMGMEHGMLLGKSCSTRHHINKGTLRIGSLSDYRKTENKEIADKDEGSYRFKIYLDGEVEIDPYWFDTLNQGIMRISEIPTPIYPGKMMSSVTHLQHVGLTADSFKFKDTKIEIYREALNCFIFCMSAVDDLAECSAIFNGYDDYWGISASNADKFAHKLAEALLKAIEKKQLAGEAVIPSEINLKDLEINFSWGRVMYTPRELHITSANNSTFAEFVKKMETMAFIKPPFPFSKEKEFRFQFTLRHQNHIIEPLVDSIIIDSVNLKSFVI